LEPRGIVGVDLTLHFEGDALGNFIDLHQVDEEVVVLFVIESDDDVFIHIAPPSDQTSITMRPP